MKGTRPLDNNEIRLVSAAFTGTFFTRNRGFFLLGVSTGGRISELLSLTIGDLRSQLEQATDRENALITEKSIILDMLYRAEKSRLLTLRLKNRVGLIV